MNNCGPCNMCCTLLGIRELRKPPGRVCQHSAAGKCAIYADRPTACREFQCLFLRDGLEMQYRPDLCGVNLHQLPDDHVMATVHPEFPDAWRKAPVNTLLDRLVMAGQRIIVALGDATFLLSENMTLQKVKVHIEEAA
ncbi:YkgJ family cysteine cluster protein [Sinorhizobium fredii]|uniref:YkgJ family cysteine cluster protein n=1 Tax=Rhizobium fredii TaxID=380 RepID=UPI0006861E16|nr:hypothetical protein [Sinorhizobium fredii]